MVNCFSYVQHKTEIFQVDSDRMSGKREKKNSSNAELPRGWIMLNSKRNPNRKYYFNTITKVSTWTHPSEEEAYDVKKANSKESLHFTAKRSNSNEVKKVESDSGKKLNFEIEDYDDEQEDYFNEILNDSSKNKKFISTSMKKLTTCGLLNSSSQANKSSAGPKDDNQRKSLRSSNIKAVKSNRGNVSALDLISKNYSNKKNLAKSKSNQNNLGKLDNKLVADGKFKKKKKKKSEKLKEMIQKNVQESQGLNKSKLEINFGKKNIQSQINFKIPKKNSVKEGNVLECHSSNERNIAENCKNKVSLTQTTNADLAASFSPNEYHQNLCDSVVEQSLIEEMDWEPCDEETDARNINEVCLQMEITKTISNDVYHQMIPENVAIQFSQDNSLVLVLDTNILISCLNFIKELTGLIGSDFSSLIFYIPFRVLQELDHLKSIRSSSGDKQLSQNARKAIAFLNENFKNGNPNFRGQSYSDFSKIADENSSPDNEILKTCLQLKNSHNFTVVLLTNDKNLETKAHVSNLEAYSKERFKNKYLTRDIKERSSSSGNAKIVTTKIAHEVNSRLKNILKDFFSKVVEIEMKDAFNEDWIKICYRKPPWSLKDTLDCILKHRIAVFSLVFDKKILTGFEDLSSIMFKTDSDSFSALTEVLKISQELLKSIKIQSKGDKAYRESIDETLNAISDLIQKISNNECFQLQVKNDLVTAKNLSVTQSVPCQSFSSHQLDSSEFFNQVKNLFKWIWDSLKEFCDSLSSIASSPVINNNIPLSELKSNLLLRHSELSELISLIEKGLEANLNDIREVHPSIALLSDFLVRSLSTGETNPKLWTDLPKYLTAFFSSQEGRNLLNWSLTDFKHFSQTMLMTCDFIDRSCCNV